MKKVIGICLSVFICCSLFSSNKIDSLKRVIVNQPNDTNKVKSLYRLALAYNDSNFNFSVKYAKESSALAEKLLFYKYQVIVNNYLGDKYFNLSSLEKSSGYYYAAFTASKASKDKFLIANCYYNLGWASAIRSNNFADVHYLYSALALSKEIKKWELELQLYNALGSFYTNKYSSAKSKNDFDSSVKYFNAGLELMFNKKLQRKAGPFYVNLGQLFHHSEDYKSALFYFEKAKESTKTDSSIIVISIQHIGMVEYELGNYELAIAQSELAIQYATRKNWKELKYDGLEVLMKVYSKTKDFEKAFNIQSELLPMKIEFEKETHLGSIQNMEMNYNFEKAEIMLEKLTQENELNELKNKRKSYIIFGLIGVGLVIILIAFLLLKQNKIRKLSNLKLQEQNKIITEKKEEIEQSIEYAKGIQTVFLPDKKVLDAFTKNNFIYYKPKDVVSGDFYWFHRINSNEAIIICADCTGHGVPGALMSMVGINTLNQLCIEQKIHSPGALLQELNNAIKFALKQNSDTSKQQDGMDLGAIRLNLKENTLVYSGANRPLYLVRNNDVEEYKATKYAIGGYTPINQMFNEIEINLMDKDFVCLSTDGYADQFGGPQGKKLMTKSFKKMLVDISKLTSYEQLTQTELLFNAWKADYAQVDDVCVVGIVV